MLKTLKNRQNVRPLIRARQIFTRNILISRFCQTAQTILDDIFQLLHRVFNIFEFFSVEFSKLRFFLSRLFPNAQIFAFRFCSPVLYFQQITDWVYQQIHRVIHTRYKTSSRKYVCGKLPFLNLVFVFYNLPHIF